MAEGKRERTAQGAGAPLSGFGFSPEYLEGMADVGRTISDFPSPSVSPPRGRSPRLEAVRVDVYGGVGGEEVVGSYTSLREGPPGELRTSSPTVTYPPRLGGSPVDIVSPLGGSPVGLDLEGRAPLEIELQQEGVPYVVELTDPSTSRSRRREGGPPPPGQVQPLPLPGGPLAPLRGALPFPGDQPSIWDRLVQSLTPGRVRTRLAQARAAAPYVSRRNAAAAATLAGVVGGALISKPSAWFSSDVSPPPILESSPTAPLVEGVELPPQPPIPPEEPPPPPTSTITLPEHSPPPPEEPSKIPPLALVGGGALAAGLLANRDALSSILPVYCKPSVQRSAMSGGVTAGVEYFLGDVDAGHALVGGLGGAGGTAIADYVLPCSWEEYKPLVSGAVGVLVQSELGVRKNALFLLLLQMGSDYAARQAYPGVPR